MNIEETRTIDDCAASLERLVRNVYRLGPDEFPYAMHADVLEIEPIYASIWVMAEVLRKRGSERASLYTDDIYRFSESFKEGITAENISRYTQWLESVIKECGLNYIENKVE